MAAGMGADQQVQRLADRLEQKRDAIAALEEEAAALEVQLRNWRAGAEGERLVAAELEHLHEAGWRLLHDVHWPGRPKANLDHVAIGRGGVLVIDAKNWSASALVRNDVLSCDGYRKTKECEAVVEMTAAVAALLEPPHRSAVRGALCLVRQDQAATTVRGGAVVIGRRQLCGWLASLPVQLDPTEVEGIASSLQAALAAPTSPAQLTTRHLPAGGGLPEQIMHQRRVRPPNPSAALKRPTSHRPVGRGSSRRSARGASPLRKMFAVLALLITAPLWLTLAVGTISHVVSAVVAGALQPPPAPAVRLPGVPVASTATPGG